MSKKSAKGSSCSDLFDSNGNKIELSEMGVSAKKAETSLAECCKNALGELGQAGSVAIGCGEAGAPHFEEETREDGHCENKEEGKIKNCDDENCDDPRCGQHSKADEKSDMKNSDKKNSDMKDESEEEKEVKGQKITHLPLSMDLAVAGGLALLAVEKAGQVMHHAAEDWEGKIDSVAEKAHATIESAQKVMKHPVGETMRKVDQLKHTKKAKKKAS